jgi:hypothetical protein
VQHALVAEDYAGYDSVIDHVSSLDELIGGRKRMSPGELQMKLVLLANKIELAIMMFETETACLVSSITLKRTPDGEADVSVNTSAGEYPLP